MFSLYNPNANSSFCSISNRSCSFSNGISEPENFKEYHVYHKNTSKYNKKGMNILKVKLIKRFKSKRKSIIIEYQ